jgi:Domain of unknown function (DUF222)/HNH endonuclease
MFGKRDPVALAVPVAARHAVAQLAAAIDTLATLDLARLDRDELLTMLGELETQRRRLPVLDHALVGELDQRGVAGDLAARNTRSLLRDVLRLSPEQAKARYDAAIDLGPRRSLTGEALPPLLPAVAAAQAAGSISPAHARVIARAIETLPAAVEREHGPAVETRLVAEATRFDPTVLARIARHLGDLLDPDGALAAHAELDQRRHATLTGKPDGSGLLRAHLTPTALAQWQAVLDPLAAPHPTDADGPDRRTPGQRLHDALADAAALLLASDDLPPAGGTPATVLVTMTVDQLEERTGVVTTAHGGTLTAAEALTLAGQANLIPVVLDHTGILSYGQARRTASTGQRHALAARDKGCCFPGCDAPPGWTQAHHIRPWTDSGRTDLENLCLLCGYHHRQHHKRGWRVIMRRGRPWWIPPAHIDPHQIPMRNTIHDRLTG